MIKINEIINEFAKSSLFDKHETVIIGITGQAGAGKTYISKYIAADYPVIDFDWFFLLSRSERSRWLDEGKKIGPEEWQKRADQSKWWNFEKARYALRQIKLNGEKITLENVYDRDNNGELTGRHEIALKNNLLIIEGVPIILLEEIDVMIYIHADDVVRKQRIIKRDGEARMNIKAEERWLITQHFETKLFLENIKKIDCVIDNSGSTIQKTTIENLQASLEKQKEALPALRPLYY